MNTQDYLLKFKIPPKIHSPEQLLATEIYEWAKGRISFPRLLGMMKSKGTQFVRECWATAKDSKVRDPVAYFFSLYGKIKIVKNER